MEALQVARTNKDIWGEVVSYLMVTAVVARGLVGYPEVALQIVILLAIYVLLILAEPLLRRQPGWGQPLFILAQIGVMIGLFILTPLADFWAVMLLPTCIYVMRRYPQRVGWVWIGIFLLATSVMIMIGQGWPDALEFIIIYIAAYLLVGSYALLLRQTVEAEREGQRLLHELQESNAQLQHYLAQVEELAALKERNRLARELHDAVTQSIFSMTLITRSALILQESDPKQVKDKLLQLQELAQGALQEMRTLIYQLRTMSAEEDGLIPVLERFIEGINGRDKLNITLDSKTRTVPLTAVQQQELYRIIQEAVNNIVKHAQTTEASVRLELMDSALIVTISDDGVGFDPAQSADQRTHIGLHSMRERAQELGGTLSVGSTPGAGTEIKVIVPKTDARIPSG